MEILIDGFSQAVRLILSFDSELVSITRLSLFMSGLATFVSIVIGIPAAFWLYLSPASARKRFILTCFCTGMGFPTVVIGLIITVCLWRGSLLGSLDLLYTPAAVILAQVVLCVPVILSLSYAALKQVPPSFKKQLLILGANRRELALALFLEARFPLLCAVMAGFGTVISEVGSVLLVGGNISGSTRVLTGAIFLETRMGNFETAIALGMILMLVIYAFNFGIIYLSDWGETPT